MVEWLRFKRPLSLEYLSCLYATNKLKPFLYKLDVDNSVSS